MSFRNRKATISAGNEGHSEVLHAFEIVCIIRRLPFLFFIDFYKYIYRKILQNSLSRTQSEWLRIGNYNSELYLMRFSWNVLWIEKTTNSEFAVLDFTLNDTHERRMDFIS